MTCFEIFLKVKGKSCVRIKNLKPHTRYTFNVQAQIIRDKTKISSKRATLTIDTSSYISKHRKAGAKLKSKQRLTARYNILKINSGLSAEISWKSRKKTKYGVSWESTCGKKTSAVVILVSRYIIPHLEKNCVYNVTIKEINECKKRRRMGKLTFRTD